ncbi:TDP2 [Acanthosepion pharaonis]|uniref:Tyrosyl-DNA phosphodiesterase 2 n=1 Tax=Acanthosepion pharaonis TaxID=158019 RepID=A0A812CEI0_ACAPH|nr:TDP2 [Sepia pharaonis]
MSDSSEDEAEYLPSGDECKRRCDEFVNVTGTNSALAMFFLQNVKWDLQAAINYYFEKNGGAPPSLPNSLKRPRDPEESTADTNPSAKRHSSIEPAGLLQKAAKNEDKRIRLLSWNIDGLDTNNLKTRTKFVCQVIANENPHIVFLQEVVPEAVIILKKLCPGYRFTVSGLVGYFTAILLKESDVKFESEGVQPFYSSVMSRSLLEIECQVKSMSFLLINTHLESMGSHSAERKKQLKAGFQKVQEADNSRTVIFGGDLNLREKELTEIGLPSHVIDVWSATGERPEAKFTWDLTRNDNKVLEGKRYQPKCRFDRIYLRHPKAGTLVKPVYFELVGLERIPKCQRFASDHWGLLAHFDIQV